MHVTRVEDTSLLGREKWGRDWSYNSRLYPAFTIGEGISLRVIDAAWWVSDTLIAFEVANKSERVLTADPREWSFTATGPPSRHRRKLCAPLLLSAYEKDGGERVGFLFDESIKPGVQYETFQSSIVLAAGPTPPGFVPSELDLLSRKPVRIEEPSAVSIARGSTVLFLATYRCRRVNRGHFDLVLRDEETGEAHSCRVMLKDILR